MEAKEKAEELFKKYEDCYPKNYDKTGRNFFTDRIKTSALIAVDEIINTGLLEGTTTGVLKKYWTEVKQGIEKL